MQSLIYGGGLKKKHFTNSPYLSMTIVYKGQNQRTFKELEVTREGLINIKTDDAFNRILRDIFYKNIFGYELGGNCNTHTS